ncbi:MAG: PqiC family protein [Candidatus Binatia bacterium]|nr:PqiC family protein [Candidatus Binatia bacterium]
MSATRLAGLAWAILGTAGCLSLVPVAPAPRDYRPDYPPPQMQHERLPVVLRLAPVRVAAIYDREPFAYRRGPYRIGYYYYHRWATAPGQLLTDFFVRDFTVSGLYRAVQQGPSVLVADYQLDLRVDRFEEEIDSSGCRASLVLHASLQSLRSGVSDPVRFQRVYEESEPVACNSPDAFVAGVSRILARLSRQLQDDVYRAVADTEAQLPKPMSLSWPVGAANAAVPCFRGSSLA